MVYCKLEMKNGSVAVYSIGGKVDDLTGTLSVDFESGEYVLEKEPERSKVYNRHIEPMLAKAIADYREGTIKERMAYEIG